ncbi:disease resistance protein, partial [Trifolium medium]|nr:disease resistance protein [Trifolium medium]
SVSLKELVNDCVVKWLREAEIILQEVENVTAIMAEPGSMDEPRQLTNDDAMRYRHEMLNKLKQGSGKTKLVKAVAGKAKHLRIFDVVLFVTMTQNPNVRQVQDEIAKSLNMNFDVNTEPERAKKIYSALESMDCPILVILDDVREKIDQGDVGIPYHSNQCKVLLTARSQPKCAAMNCQQDIPLNPLTTEEAWTLFKKHIDIDDFSSTDLLNVACKVAIECEGLPGKIKEMAYNLRNKPINEWNLALDTLRALYDIFLSFTGKDTRDSFTGFLFDALCQKGFKVFMDEVGLKGGDEIASSLIKGIEASRISIVVFSKNFAYSSWCLDELVTILECKKTKNLQILPIFYKIEPFVVRHQKKSYEKAMAKHEKKFGNDSEKVRKWRSALSEVANLSGIHHKSG